MRETGRCVQCGGSLVEAAQWCPHCGLRVAAEAPGAKTDGERRADSVVGISAVVALTLFLGYCAVTECGGPTGQGGRPGNAWLACQEFVKRQLRAPGSAEFENSSERNVREGTAGRFTVSGWVDAANGFGAVVRTEFECNVAYSDGGWDLIDLDVAQ